MYSNVLQPWAHRNSMTAPVRNITIVPDLPSLNPKYKKDLVASPVWREAEQI